MGCVNGREPQLEDGKEASGGVSEGAVVSSPPVAADATIAETTPIDTASPRHTALLIAETPAGSPREAERHSSAPPSPPLSVSDGVQVEVLEVDLEETTPPLSLLSVVVSFAGDLPVQTLALRYLASAAFEHQGVLSEVVPLRGLVAVCVALCEGDGELQIAVEGSPRERREGNVALALCLKCLSGIVERNSAAQERLLQEGGLRAARTSLELQKDKEVLFEALRLVSVLLASVGAVKMWCASSGLAKVLAAMKTGGRSVRVRQEGCRVVSLITAVKDTSILETVDWSLLMETLREAKGENTDNPTLSSLIAQAMVSSLGGFRRHAKASGLHRGEVRCICETLCHFEGDASLHSQLAELLQTLAREHCATVFREGGAEAVVTAMASESASQHVFQAGAGLMCELAKVPSQVPALISMGCTQSLVAALRYHPTHDALAVVCIETLHTLVSHSRQRFVDCSGVSMLVCVLARSKRQEVHVGALRLLRVLVAGGGGGGGGDAGDGDGDCGGVAGELRSKQVLATLVASLRAFPSAEVPSLLESLVDAASMPLYTAVVAAVVGVGTASLDATKVPEGEVAEEVRDLHRAVLAFLACVAPCDRAAQVLGECGGVRYIVDTAWLFKTHYPIMCPAVTALVPLSRNTSASKAIRICKGIALAQYSPRHHPATADLCAKILKNLDQP